MSKIKVQTSKKQSRKNLWMQITVVVVLISFIAFFVLSNVFKSNVTTNRDLENAMSNKMTYTFQKNGELIFSTSGDKAIQKIDIELADDEAKRSVGLMMRRTMAENQGMLFLFEHEAPQAFWMHNTILPLDIIYVNSKLEIVTIIRNAKPFDDTSLPSLKPAQYVVEVNAGYCDKYGIKEGDKIVWRRD
ncbi:hypothetical protein C0389_03640 [bacterium]|nr:hypothetical protein [bacterium]